ncbi:MAG: response regulator [Acidobacteria bacterium]|nr:response regulator [Acidobacteriota bacterium]NIM60226.1 response regulator [Acidobacteriota bacterium]NIO60264.1 response regulator [Acidobacteriota bacterium]NIQ31319.1 response regulator [Acidobacteriota bacterium]NIQ86542.1 response regulator [Acidobacteriota bacterium]
MKIEICCPDCDGGYLVDSDALAAGFPCPGCGRVLEAEPAEPPLIEPNVMDVDLPASAEPTADAAPLAEVPAEPVVESAQTAPQVPLQTAVATAEVVCPRCNLHFKPRAKSQARARADTDRPTVLIVEDLVYFREIAAEALQGEFEIQAVATKDGARAALDRGGVDLMVLDLTLDGGEGGLDLLRELPGKPCPILIYTAQDESEMYGDSWDELQRLGADDIVLKGMNVGDELIRKIGSLLGRETGGED